MPTKSGPVPHNIKTGLTIIFDNRTFKRPLEVYCERFQWTSMLNGGYAIWATIHDIWYNTVEEIAKTFYLEKARKQPLEIKFFFSKTDNKGQDAQTAERTAYLSKLEAHGTVNQGILEFIAIDPPSWWLNAGCGSGQIYKGKIGGDEGVISQVVKEYAKEITLSISNTKEVASTWPIARKDPKSFITSLLDWSSSITDSKTNWIISSTDKNLSIKTQLDLYQDLGNDSKFIEAPLVLVSSQGPTDIIDFEMLAHNFISVLQTKLHTAGISATTGKIISAELTDKAIVDDENTEKKLAILGKNEKDKGFKKSTEDWVTFIAPIPEHTDGALGIKYADYIDGRARNMFLNMLGALMRIKIKCWGLLEADDSNKLGASWVNIDWKDDKNDYFLAGKWLVYGFEHVYVNGESPDWHTNLYLARIDYDAEGVRIT